MHPGLVIWLGSVDAHSHDELLAEEETRRRRRRRRRLRRKRRTFVEI
jgi:hypothetical protein